VVGECMVISGKQKSEPNGPLCDEVVKRENDQVSFSLQKNIAKRRVGGSGQNSVEILLIRHMGAFQQNSAVIVMRRKVE